MHEYVNVIVATMSLKMKVFVKLYHRWYKNMQQWWFDDGLELKSVIYGVFYGFPLIFKVFINIIEYAN